MTVVYFNTLNGDMYFDVFPSCKICDFYVEGSELPKGLLQHWRFLYTIESFRGPKNRNKKVNRAIFGQYKKWKITCHLMSFL